jgi:hypothetical protein
MCASGECAHEDVAAADPMRMAPDVDRANRLLGFEQDHHDSIQSVDET